MNNDLLQRIAQKLKEQKIIVKKTLWLDVAGDYYDGVGENFSDAREYVQEIFERKEASIIQSIGQELWNEIMPEPDEMMDEPGLAEDLIYRKGWVVEVHFSLPNIDNLIPFDGKKPIGWLPRLGYQIRLYYGKTLEAALCRALVWTARERRREFRKAWKKQYMEANRIRPCPFCGSGNVRTTGEGSYNSPYIVMCNECLCRTDIYYSEEDAIEVWNRRPGD